MTTRFVDGEEPGSTDLALSTPDCVLDECRFFDAETHEYGYAVACVADHGCGYWREMFRTDRHHVR